MRRNCRTARSKSSPSAVVALRGKVANASAASSRATKTAVFFLLSDDADVVGASWTVQEDGSSSVRIAPISRKFFVSS
jgi:hypothetical protein